MTPKIFTLTFPDEPNKSIPIRNVLKLIASIIISICSRYHFFYPIIPIQNQFKMSNSHHLSAFDHRSPSWREYVNVLHSQRRCVNREASKAFWLFPVINGLGLRMCFFVHGISRWLRLRFKRFFISLYSFVVKTKRTSFVWSSLFAHPHFSI